MAEEKQVAKKAPTKRAPRKTKPKAEPQLQPVKVEQPQPVKIGDKIKLKDLKVEQQGTGVAYGNWDTKEFPSVSYGIKDIENSDGEYTVIALSHKAVRVRINGRKAWVAKVNVELV
jgi:hypothetical protein